MRGSDLPRELRRQANVRVLLTRGLMRSTARSCGATHFLATAGRGALVIFEPAVHKHPTLQQKVRFPVVRRHAFPVAYRGLRA